jgi:hypothetical protein
MSTPDFDALRARRNAEVRKHIAQIAKEHGLAPESIRSNFNPRSCYCACSTGGPCEHVWDGPQYQDNGIFSTTCSRCSMTAISHDMRVAP